MVVCFPVGNFGDYDEILSQEKLEDASATPVSDQLAGRCRVPKRGYTKSGPTRGLPRSSHPSAGTAGPRPPPAPRALGTHHGCEALAPAS